LIKQRIKKFWQEIKKKNTQLNAFLVINPKNVFYLTQFKGEGILLATITQNYLITDSRYIEQAKKEGQHCQIIIQELKQPNAQTNSLTKLIRELGIKEIGFESNFLKVDDYLKYQTLLPELKLTPFLNIIETIRMIKDHYEIELLKKAAQIADNAFQETVRNIQPGISELSLANQLNYNMRKGGAQKEAFDLIVTSGERVILIHVEPTSKPIREDELVIIYFGSVFEMYHSDCTRTIVLGEPHKEQKEIFHIIKQVQMETLQQVKAGLKCSELDNFARSMIEKSGYGNYFQHSLGHGVGLDIHELPRLNPYEQTILQPGMIITIEPGIYIPDIGGVRIEDTVLITEKGCEILTMLPKELLVSAYF
jgi:Xaa-Pro aminopeptidase